jgi:hypothetical protein
VGDDRSLHLPPTSKRRAKRLALAHIGRDD